MDNVVVIDWGERKGGGGEREKENVGARALERKEKPRQEASG